MLDSETITELTADVVAAYVTNNSLPMGQLAEVIESVHASLSRLGMPIEVVPVQAPWIRPKKTVFPDYIVSLETGGRFKALRKHLTTLGMTPEQYRAKWRLPSDYPMTAPSYSARRSEIAKATNLGRSPAARRGLGKGNRGSKLSSI